MSAAFDEIRRDRRLTLDGRALEATWFGPPPGVAPTLVFLHEGLGCVAMWKDFPERLALATGCGALVYSRYGYAGSDPAPLPRVVEYLRPEAVEVLPAVLAATGVSDAILVGHSDGGSIALLHCGATPAPTVRGAITMGAHVFVEDLTTTSIEEAKVRYEAGDLKRALEKYHGPATERAFRGWNDIWLLPAFRHWNIEDCLPGIRTPLLVIQGVDDPYGSPAQVSAIARQTGGPVQTLMIPDCKHWPHLEQSQVTLAAMQAFVHDCLARG